MAIDNAVLGQGQIDPQTQQPLYDRSTLFKMDLELARQLTLGTTPERQVGQFFPREGSKYLDELTYSDLENVPEAIAQRQSTIDKWSNATAKMGITALTTFLDGTVGTVIGLQNMAQGDGKLSDFVNNPFIQGMLDVQEWSERILPNYYTQQEQETPWYENLGTANFWADKVLKNFGFAIGAYAAGALTAGAGATLTGSRALQASLGSKVGKGLMTKLLTGNLDDVAEKALLTELTAGGRGLTDDLVKGIIQDSKKLKTLNLTNQVIGSIGGAVGEARIEAGHAIREFTEEAKAELDARYQSGQISDDQYQTELQDIEKKSLSVGNHVFALNTAILSASNFAQFRHAFAGGYEMQKKAIGQITRDATTKEFAATLPTTTLGKVARKAGALGVGFKNVLVEGNEEMLQRVASESSKDHYRRMLDGAEGGADEFINSIWEGFGNTYGNVDAWEEFVIGAFSGGIGIPTIQNKKIQIAGGIWSDLSEQTSKDKRTAAVVDKLNQIIKTPQFQARYFALNQDMISEQKKQKALASDDIFEWKTEDDAQFAHMVNTFYNAGQLDQLYDWIDGMEKATPDEIREFMAMNKTKDADGKIIESPEVVDYFKNVQPEEIAKRNKERAAKLRAKISEVQEVREAIDVKFGGTLSDESKNILASQLIGLRSIDTREQNIHEQIRKINNLFDGRAITDIARKASSLTTKEGWINTFNNKSKAAKSQITRLNNLVQALEDKVIEAQSKSDVPGAVKARRAAATESAKTSKWRDKITEYKEKIENLQKDLDSMLQEEYEARTKLVESSPELYQDMTFDEYKNEVMSLSDRIDEFEDLASKSYGRVGENPITPDRAEKLNTYIKDLFKLNSLRMNYLKNYIDSVEKLQKDSKAFEKMRKEVENEIADRNADAMIKRVLSGAEKLRKGFNVKNNETGEEFRVKKVGNEVRVLGKNSIGSFSIKTGIKVDREFVKNYTPSSEFDARQEELQQVLQELQEQGKLTVVDLNNSGISINGETLVVSGRLHTYTVKRKDPATDTEIEVTEKYLKAPDGKFYRIYNEGDDSILSTRKYSEQNLSTGKLTDSTKNVTIPFEGRVMTNAITGEKFLVKAEHLPELDELIKKQETVALTEEEQKLANLEADERSDELFMENVSNETLNNPDKTLLIFTKYLGKDEKGNWKYEKFEIKDTKEGRKKLEEFIKKYSELNDGASLYGALYDIIRQRGVEVEKSRADKNYEKKSISDLEFVINDVKYHVSLPSKPPKKVVIVARDRKTKSGKTVWGKPIEITDPVKLKEIAGKIKISEKGNKYIIDGRKFYFVKEVDFIGDNAKYAHWKYKYNILNKKDGKYIFENKEGDEVEITNVDEFLASAVKGVDYVETSKGNLKIFRNVDPDEGIIKDTYTGARQIPAGKNKWKVGMHQLYDDVDQLEHVAINDNNYTAIKNGDKIGIQRKLWKYPITTIDNNTTLGKGSEVTYLEKRHIFIDQTIYWSLPVVTEPSGENTFDPDPKFYLVPNSLFAGTMPTVNPIIGSAHGIDNQPDKVKRVTNYLNTNNIKDGEHFILIVSGKTIGDNESIESSNSVKIVLAKKFEGEVKPIDEKGNAISIEEVFKKGIFQEAPLPERFSTTESVIEKGKYAVKDSKSLKENGEISIPTDKKAVDTEITRYKTWYDKISKNVLEDEYESKVYTILKATKGQNLLRPVSESRPTRESLKHLIDSGNYKLHIGTAEATKLETTKDHIQLVPGYVYMEDLTSGNIYQLQTNKLNEQQQETVIKILETFVSNFKVLSDGTISMENAGSYMNVNLFRDGIENYVFFQDRNNIKKEGLDKLSELLDKLKDLDIAVKDFLNNPETGVSKLAEIERKQILNEFYGILKGTDKKYQINSNPKTQFYFLDHETIPGGLIVIGGKENGVVLPLLDQSDIKSLKLNPAVEAALREFLPNRNFNVVKTSNKLNNNEPFQTLEYENGELVLKEYDSYNDYVIDNTTTASVEYGEDNITTVGKKVVFEVLDSDIKDDFDGTPNPDLDPEDFEEGPDLSRVIARGSAKNNPSNKTKEDSTSNEDFEEGPDLSRVIAGGNRKLSGATRSERKLRVIRNKEGKFQLENKEKFLKWVAKNLGEQFAADYIRIEDVVIEGRWGEFSDGLIKLYKDAAEGTGYHEVFHAVIDMFLTAKEFDRIVIQVKNDYRFNKRLEEVRKLYPNLSEKSLIEEVLAEEFSDYILTEGKSLANRKQPKLKGLFRLLQRLYDWITGANKDRVRDLFDKINTGQFKNAKIIKKSDNVSKSRVKKTLRGDKQFEVDAMNTVSAFFFSNLYNNTIVPNGLYEIFGQEGVNSKLIEQVYDSVKNDIKELIEDHSEDNRITPAARKHYIKELQYLVDHWEDEIVPFNMQYLRKFGIEEVESIDINSENYSGKSESGSAYNYSSLRVSSKASATKMMKALIGGLAMKNTDGSLVYNNIGGPKLGDFGQLFSILSNHLANTTTLEEKLPILESLYSKSPELQKLGVDILRIRTFLENPLAFNAKDVETLARFNQTFSKNTNRYVYALLGSGGQYKVEDANTETMLSRVKSTWRTRFSKSIENYKDNDKVIKKGNTYYYNPKYFSKYNNRGRLDVRKEAEFVNDVGIYIDKDVLRNVTAGKVDFLNILFKNILEGNQSTIFSRNADANFTGRLDEFIQASIEGTVDYVENAHFNIDGDLVYNNTVNSPISIMFNKFNKIAKLPLEERQAALKAELPFWDRSFTYNANSLILNRLFKSGSISLELEIHEGVSKEGGEGSKTFKDFSEPDRLYSWYKMAAQGKYVLMRPSDNGIERFISVPRTVLTFQFPKQTLLGYLADEMNFAADKSNLRFLNFQKHRYNNILLDILAEAKEQTIYEEAVAAINENTVERFIAERGDEIYMIFDNHIKRVTEAVEARFREYGITNDMLTKDYPIESFVRQHLFMAIEQTKLITGNIALFKNMDDMFKRNSAVANTKNITWVGKRGQSIEKWIAKNLRRFDKANPNSEDNWYNDSPVLKTIIINDVVATSKYAEEYRKILGDRAEGYEEYDETDGFSFESADEHREFHFRSGSWTQEREDRYQYEMQMFLHHVIQQTDNQSMKNTFKRLFNIDYNKWKHPINPETFKRIVLNPSIKINSDKPQYRGPLAVDGFYPTMYKTSFLPIYPSLFMDLETGKITNPNMYKLFMEMSKKSVGVVAFYSANKGATTMINTMEDVTNISDDRVNTELLQPLYNEKGSVNSFDNFIVQPTLYEYWGIQVDTGFKEKFNVVYGTQMLAQLRNGVFDMGAPLAGKEELGELINSFEAKNNERIALGLKILESKLGLKFDNGKWTYDDSVETFIEALEREAISRNMPDNVLNSIYYLEELKLPIDALINSDKMQTILFSMADKTTISQKAFGKAPYQVPSTLFEQDGLRVTKDFKGTDRIVSNNLNFYEPKFNDNGELTGVGAMEVLLPSYFKGNIPIGKLSTKENQELLRLVGFRIPTQGLNSIESIVVKGFISDAYGDVIVLPSEIVAKTGSDFDIDKIQIYIPNFYYDEKGKPTIYSGDRSKFDKDTLVKTTNSIINNALTDAFGEMNTFKIRSLIDSIKKEAGGFINIGKLITKLREHYESRTNYPAQFIVFIENLETAYNNSEWDIALLDDNLYAQKVIENEMLALMHEIILHPDNARQLLNPIDSDYYKTLAKELRTIREANTADKSSAVKSSHKGAYHLYGNPLHHLQVAKQNMEGAGAIGIASNSAKFQIYAALHDLGIADRFKIFKTKLNNEGNQESEIVATQINLPHNKRYDGRISIGGLMDVNNELPIYESFNSYITLTVDNAKNPVLDDLNSGLKTMNTVLYLAMAGVHYKTIHYFMNQPSIIKYIENLTKYESEVLKINDLDKFSDEILDITLREFGAKEDYKVNLNNPGNEVYDIKELKKMVEDPNNKNYNSAQRQLLLDFIRYQRTATEISNAIQATQYDTKSFGRNEVEAMDLLRSTEKVINDNIILGYEKLFEEGFLKEYKNVMESVLERLEQFSVVNREPAFKEQFDKMLERYHDNRMKLGRERRLEVLNSWKKDVMSYLLLSRKYKTSVDGKLNSPMIERTNELFTGEDSVPSRLALLKDIMNAGDLSARLEGEYREVYDRIKNNKLLSNLIPEIDLERPFHNISLHTRRLDANETDLMTEGWRELIEADDSTNVGKFLNEVGMDLVEFTLIQSGMQGSPMTLVEFIPFEIFSNIAGSVLSDNISPEDAKRYAVQFYLHNYTNNDIVKKVTEGKHKDKKLGFEKDLFPVYKVATVKPDFEKWSVERRIAASRKGIEVYEPVPTLYTSSDSKKIPAMNNAKAFRVKISRLSYGSKEMNKFADENSDKFDMRTTKKIEQSRKEVITQQQYSNPQYEGMPELANEVYEALGFGKDSNYYENDIKPKPNTIFVFGSNPEGRHGLGAAKIARQQFGAIYGQGEGLQGNSYALPTKDLRVKENKGLRSISPKQIIDSIIKLYDVAEQNPDKQFKVAYRNTTDTSYNGYTGLEMIEMFNNAAQIGIGYIPSNVIFSKEWFDTGKLNIQPQITPEQKQEAQQWYSEYLGTIFPDYIDNFAYEAFEEFLVVSKIIDRKC